MAQAAPDRILLLGTEVTYSGFPSAPSYAITGVTSGTSQPIDYKSHGIIAVYVRGIGTITGGTLLVEEADYGPYENPYSGTWSQLTSIPLTPLSGGAQQAYHITDSAYRYLRVRISATVTGGGTILVSLCSRGAA